MRLPDSRAAKFLSTPSARRATFAEPSSFRVVQFLSTPSARRATDNSLILHPCHEFLSTPSARRATRPEWRQGQGLQISIHALREEGDLA